MTRIIRAMALDEYRKKRKFDQTPDPADWPKSRRGLSFVIHKHCASGLLTIYIW